jgi:glycosyltransferase involved in cell wall biosynthesis
MEDYSQLRNWPKEEPRLEETPTDLRQAWPLVSIVTPSFNQAPFLEDCIRSVLHQSYPNLEFWIMDGGSIDTSLDIIQHYSNQLAGWQSQPDAGQADAINQGWQRSAGKYMWWLNSDDLLMPGSLFTSVSYLENHPQVDMVYGDVLRIDQEGQITERYNYPAFELSKMLLDGLDIPQPGSLVRRAVIDEVGPLDPELHFVMDMEYWQRIGLAGKTICHIPEPMAMFRIYDKSKTQAGSERAVEERMMAAQRVLKHPDCPDEVKQNKRIFLYSVHLACSRTWMKNGRFIRTLGSLLRAVSVNPRGLMEGRMYYTFLLAILGLFLGWERWSAVRARFRRRKRREA